MGSEPQNDAKKNGDSTSVDRLSRPTFVAVACRTAKSYMGGARTQYVPCRILGRLAILADSRA